MNMASMETQAIKPTHSPLPFQKFIWGAGVECSFIPHLNVNQFEWTQHDRFCREDLTRAKDELGITHLRYALPWHEIEAKRGKFDWKAADERLQCAKDLGLELLLDVMHFGTPLWLKQAAGDPEFPEALEHFTSAMVERYHSMVKIWSPCNEPLVLALFSGDFGFWPPHARKWRGYMPVLSRVVQATSRSIRAIRRQMPEATVLLCDAAESYKTRDKQLQGEVARRNLRRFLVMDLLLGRVDANHPLYSWLNAYGLSDLDLEWFRSNPQTPDVFGLDYYPHSDWQLDRAGGGVRQHRADKPIGLHGVANAYWQRYGIPMMLTETSIEGQAINREIWLDSMVDDIRRLREDGVPMLGLIWWPMIDQLDWDGALTHRVGKIHEVGLFNLHRQSDGTLKRSPSPLVEHFRELAGSGEQLVGKLENINYPSAEAEEEQLPPLGEWIQPQIEAKASSNGNGNGNGHAIATPSATKENESAVDRRLKSSLHSEGDPTKASHEAKSTDRYGIVVFCHLRWGFVWQRPQQFLSRFARKHSILFVEEPFFDKPEGSEPDIQYHRVMPNVTVVCPHVAASWNKNPKLPEMLRKWTAEAIERMNEDGEFDKPLLWYYSPMDSSWSLGYFPNRGVVYDCMDELANFAGAPKALVDNEKRLMQYADVVFTGGYEMGEKRKKIHPNVHIFGCGVEFKHFNKAADSTTAVPPDIDFMPRPILGWFGVIDERVDYGMIGEMARKRPDWSFAMVGPVVKVDPNLLPHSPNLFWLGGRDYQQLPNYCAAFDVCMMPFAMNASTQYINPTKGLEYMATGKPIVSTPVRDVVRQWSDIVRITEGADGFISAAESALRKEEPERVAKGLELAKKSSWESTVATMQDLIRSAIGSSSHRSGPKIEPISESELEYQYQTTKGS
ncbi:MAG TPA: family 1 glycosylhydrolase [Tepidisphaeraceae bacterium]|jgi:beta-glucosidase/6-phospho-beta-glucosidase/beta-galactosidase